MSHDKICLRTMQDYYAKNRVLPGFPAIGKLTGLPVGLSVPAMLTRLKLTGYLAFTPEKYLSPTRRFFEREIVGSVVAGFPSPASEGLTDTVSIDEYLVEQPSCTALLTIEGDSMIDAGLMPGDVVIVEKGAPAGIGEIVVAIVDNEFSVKYLEKDQQGFYLNPANPGYPPIRPKAQLDIYGVVAGLFRKYKRRR